MNKLSLISFAILGGVILFLFIENKHKDAKLEDLINKVSMIEYESGKSKIDTNSVKEIHHYHTTVNNIPFVVEAQTKPDTTYRNKIEKGDIVTGVKFKPGEIDIQKIDSSGHMFENRHKIKEGSTVTIDSTGGVNEKKASFISGLKLYVGGEVGVNNLAPQVFLTTLKGWTFNANYDVLNMRTNVGIAKKVSFKWIKRK